LESPQFPASDVVQYHFRGGMRHDRCHRLPSAYQWQLVRIVVVHESFPAFTTHPWSPVWYAPYQYIGRACADAGRIPSSITVPSSVTTALFPIAPMPLSSFATARRPSASIRIGWMAERDEERWTIVPRNRPFAVVVAIAERRWIVG
jgi:hypothetical protein